MLPILESAKQEILDALTGFSSSFEQWKVDWTPARAKKIDSIGSGINTIIDRGSVKVVQRGYVTKQATSGTHPDSVVTISHVDWTKAYIRLGGIEAIETGRVVSLTPTSFTITWDTRTSTAKNLMWEIVEFY